MGYKKDKKEKVEVRCSKKEKKLLDKMAEAEGLTRSAYMRQRLFKKDKSVSQMLKIIMQQQNLLNELMMQTENERLKGEYEKIWQHFE